MFENNEIVKLFNSKKFVLYSIIGIFTVKLIGDFILSYFFGAVSFDDNIIWKFITTSLLMLFGYSYIKEILKPKIEAYNSAFFDNYKDDIQRLIFLFLIGIVLSIVQDKLNLVQFKTGVPIFIFLQIFGWYYIILGYYATTLFIQWINVRKNKRTKLFKDVFLYGFGLIIFNILLIKALKYYLDLSGLAEFFDVLATLLYIFIALLGFLLPYDNEWINLLDSYKKKNLKIYSLFLTIILFVSYSLLVDSTGMQNSINLIYPNLHLLILYPTIAITAYQTRILFATFRSKTKRTNYQKKIDGISTLNQFNKFILETKTTDRSHLLNEFMTSIITVISADFAWAEDYDEEFQCIYRSIYNTDNAFLDKLNNLSIFRSYVLSNNTSFIVPSLKELILKSPKLYLEGTIAVIPVLERQKRIGTIFLGRYKEYSFSFDEVQMINTFATNYAVALENSILLSDSLEKRRYAFELQLAQGIQKKIIPQEIPKIKNYSIAGISIPAQELGGDYYDLVYLKNNKPTLLIADVSGKGVSAALYMSQLKGVVMSVARTVSSPIELLKLLNDILHKSTEKQIFITLAAITIENDRGLVKYVRAGHSPLIIKQNGKIYEEAPKGIALGVANPNIFDNNCEEIEIQLQPGDFCFAYTDGFDELRNSQNSEFGTEKIRNLLIHSNTSQAQDLIDGLMEHIRNFMNGTNQFDDLTLLSIIYQGENDKDGK